MQIILDAMEVRKFDQGQTVIRQGEDGNELFLIGEGTLRCTKVYPDSKEEVLLKTYEQGEYFGELALLYNAPRAATIIATTPVVLYSLDRECFNSIVKDSASALRAKLE